MTKPTAYDSAPWLRHYATGTRPGSIAMPYRSIPELVSRTATRFRHLPAFTTCMPNGMNGSLSFAQIEEMSDAFAVYLREHLRLLPGSRVAVQMPNCLAYPVVAFGVFKANCVLVNVNPLYTPGEMEHQLKDSGAVALVILDMFMDKLEPIQTRTPVRHVITASVAQWFPRTVRRILQFMLQYWNRVIPVHNVNNRNIDEALRRGRELRDQEPVNVRNYWTSIRADTTAMLQYTGGTTGVSKGAELSHGNILANIQQLDLVAGQHIDEGRETALAALPLYHIFAFSVNLLALYKMGTHNILVPSPRPIQNCQRAIENYPITWMSGVNTLYNALLGEEWFYRYPPETIKVALAGGTALHRSVASRWQRVVGCPIAEGYGLTETSPVLCFNPIDDPRQDSIGIPVPGTDICIVDEDDNPLPPGQTGELIARGPQVTRGYWKHPEETAGALRDGWFYTGDMAYMDDEAFFHVVDRKKDMILVSGFNVYPNEIEDCLALLDEVQESAVIGIPDERSGEAVQAYVVLRGKGLSADDIRRHCRRHLTSYKVPRRILFREALPRSTVGKVLRRELRDEVPGQGQTAKGPLQTAGHGSAGTQKPEPMT